MRKHHPSICLFSAVALWVVLACLPVQADPYSLRYHARLSNAGQLPDAAGLVFALYSAQDKLLWNNFDGAANSRDPGALPDLAPHARPVPFVHGQVDLILGSASGNTPNDKPLPSSAFYDASGPGTPREGVRLAVWWVDGHGSGHRLEPDVVFAAVPYAHVARTSQAVSLRSITPEHLVPEAGASMFRNSGLMSLGLVVLDPLVGSAPLEAQGFIQGEGAVSPGDSSLQPYFLDSFLGSMLAVFDEEQNEVLPRQETPLVFDSSDPVSERTLVLRNHGASMLGDFSVKFNGRAAGFFEVVAMPSQLMPDESGEIRIRCVNPLLVPRDADMVLGAGAGRGTFPIPLRTSRSSAPEFSLIPQGDFQMGDALGEAIISAAEQPLRQVSLDAFYMKRTLVTAEEWEQVRAWGSLNGYTDLGSIISTSILTQPADYRTWWQAVKWCNARSEMERLQPVYSVGGEVMRSGSTSPVANWQANGYRLPTEAEWERAARGGLSGKRYPWGDTISHELANYESGDYGEAWVMGNLSPYGRHPEYEYWGVAGYPGTSPVGAFPPNGFGLYDMAGNVPEWCWDFYNGGYYAAADNLVNPTGPVTGSERVVRGGSYQQIQYFSRVANRDQASAGTNWSRNGFRIVRRAEPLEMTTEADENEGR